MPRSWKCQPPATSIRSARAYSGFIPAALKSRCGVFVAVASPSDGDLFGVRLPRNAGPGPLGRGLLVRPAGVTPIQLALADD